MRGSVGFFGLIVLVFGIAIPARSGMYWITIPWSAITWAWLPLMLVMAVVADSFAGERERHTLETLLASRLSDAAILLGKVAAAVVFAWGMLLLVAVMSLLTVNISVLRPDPWTHLLLWRWEETFGVVVVEARSPFRALMPTSPDAQDADDVIDWKYTNGLRNVESVPLPGLAPDVGSGCPSTGCPHAPICVPGSSIP